MLELISWFLLAVGLSADSFAVSVSSGLVLKKIDLFNAMKIAFSLALFQTMFTLAGWFLGSQIKEYIIEIDHWVAFILLSFIGLRMIYQSQKKSKKEKQFNPLNILVLIGLSIATSLDALIVGVSFAFINIKILIPLIMIGSVTFIASMLGILFGKKTGERFGIKIEIFGGVILIIIGVKILIEHIYF